MNRSFRVLVALLAVGLVAAGAAACNRNEDSMGTAVEDSAPGGNDDSAGGDAESRPGAGVYYVDGEELLCLVESEAEAQSIADMYGIELVKYQKGVATFHTEDNPNKVIKTGLEKGAIRSCR